jgi:UDP-N-acetylmuramoyl-tripeptide--D-alanyl-D-alanine ligase
MEVHQLPGNVTIINDAYNANPESMTAALKTLTTIPAAGKTFAILGKMHELGDASDVIHVEVAKSALGSGVNNVIAVGPPAGAYGLPQLSSLDSAAGAQSDLVQKAVWLQDFDQACDYIVKQVNVGDVLLFKASRAEHFEVLAERIEILLRAKWGQK